MQQFSPITKANRKNYELNRFFIGEKMLPSERVVSRLDYPDSHAYRTPIIVQDSLILTDSENEYLWGAIRTVKDFNPLFIPVDISTFVRLGQVVNTRFGYALPFDGQIEAKRMVSAITEDDGRKFIECDGYLFDGFTGMEVIDSESKLVVAKWGLDTTEVIYE